MLFHKLLVESRLHTSKTKALHLPLMVLELEETLPLLLDLLWMPNQLMVVPLTKPWEKMLLVILPP